MRQRSNGTLVEGGRSRVAEGMVRMMPGSIENTGLDFLFAWKHRLALVLIY